MKNYNLKDYKNFSSLKSELLKDLNNELQDVEFTSNKYTACEILEIKEIMYLGSSTDFIVEVSVFGGIKQMWLKAAIEEGTIVLPTDKQTIFEHYVEQLDQAYSDYEAEIEEQSRIRDEQAEREQARHEARVAKAKALKEEAEAKAKLEAKIARDQKSFEEKITSYVKIDKTPLDWLKENTTSITATIPSHLEKIFIKIFGDVPHKVVDSSRKTSGGYSMKFGPNFSLTVKKDAVVPAELEKLFKSNKLNNTKFIARLITHYDFTFSSASK